MATYSNDSSEPMRRVKGIPGFGPIRASSFVAALGDGQAFKCGWVVSSWLGLTPCQHSTGGKPVLLGISKRGNRYLRDILIYVAHSVLRTAEAMNRIILSAVGCARLQNATITIRQSSRLQTRWHGSVGAVLAKDLYYDPQLL